MLLSRKIPVYFIFISGLSGAIISRLLISNTFLSARQTPAVTTVTEASPAAYPVKSARQKGFELIKPLLLSKQSKESAEYSALKARLMNIVDDDKKAGLLSSASIYVMNFSDGSWIYANPEENFNPGSLVKVPLLITWLKAAETDPKLLDKKISFRSNASVPPQTYTSQSIQSGHEYTVRDLLRYMIVYSDNNATDLLNRNIDVNLLKKTFTDINLQEPDVSDRNFQITAKHISKFLIVLYNSTYLSRSGSEFAMELMTQCDFKKGIVKSLPPDLKVAHKFGEWYNRNAGIFQLHESAIVYLNDKPYLLTVLLRGSSPDHLPDEIDKISRMVYDEMLAKRGATAKM